MTSASIELLEELRSQLPGGGQHRPGQLEMAKAVEDVLSRGGALSVNAPTGTGKSLAYLSGLITQQRVGPAVVATSSIALQDQLAAKDLPFIASHVRFPVRWAVLKGRSNYLCRASLETALKEGGGGELSFSDKPEEPDGVSLHDIASWAERTETGDRAELPFEPSPSLWESVSMTSEGCPGAKSCPFGHTCFAERAMAAAREADVIIVNTHLYAINVSVSGNVLPEHDVVVIDEAHEIENIFSSVLGTEVRPSQLSAIAKQFKSLVEDDRVTDRLFAVSTHMQAVLGRFEKDQRLVGGLRSEEDLAAVADEAGVAIAIARQRLEAIPENTLEKVKARLFRLRGAMNAVSEALSGVCASTEETVVWVEGGRKVRSAPLDVSHALRRWFWARTNDLETDWETGTAPPRSVVLTSATLSPSVARRLGAANPTVLSVKSPFDHRSNALLYVPELPDPRSSAEEWRTALIGELETLINAAGGRTLALFTSIAGMNEAATAIARLVPYPILIQGSLPKRFLLERFASEEQACLFGTRSFFQGVDVPGSSLSLVALDRLPFPRPDDPLVAARSDAAGAAGFSRVVIPMTATSLAQAAGRLIRTSTDRGVVAVFDPRLARAAYRSDLLAALPPMRRTRTHDDVVAFLSDITKEGDRGVGNHAA